MAIFQKGTWAYPSLIQIFFKSAQFYPSVVQKQLTTLDFVSYCGGSLGLFLGFSALSAIEIIYYFTLRLIFYNLEKKIVSICREPSEGTSKKQNYFVEVMRNSSIHGCNQTVFEKHHRFEKYSQIHWNFFFSLLHSKNSRFIWFIIVVVTLSFCGFTTFEIFKNYENAPIIMTYEDVIDTSQNVGSLRLQSASKYNVISFDLKKQASL